MRRENAAAPERAALGPVSLRNTLGIATRSGLKVAPSASPMRQGALASNELSGAWERRLYDVAGP